MVDFEEKIISLIVEWKRCLDYESSQRVTCEMGVHFGILDAMPENPEELNPETRHKILELIDRNHSSAYNAAKKIVAQGI